MHVNLCRVEMLAFCVWFILLFYAFYKNVNARKK